MNDCSDDEVLAFIFIEQPANDASTPRSIMRLFWLVWILVRILCMPGASYLGSFRREFIIWFLAFLTSALLGFMSRISGLLPDRKSPNSVILFLCILARGLGDPPVISSST